MQFAADQLRFNLFLISDDNVLAEITKSFLTSLCKREDEFGSFAAPGQNDAEER
jgi:hypothetical protein